MFLKNKLENIKTFKMIKIKLFFLKIKYRKIKWLKIAKHKQENEYTYKKINR